MTIGPFTTRRAVLAGAAALVPSWPALATPPRSGPEAAIAAIEYRLGGRVGVAALDTGNDRRIGYRADEQFAMCSTFKLLAVAAVLRRADRGTVRLDRRIRYRATDLLAYAPISKQHLQTGMTVGELCAAAIEYSDNTAANQLLKILGGPAGYTRFVRSLGDVRTRLDRNEPSLNTALTGDPRDTTTPAAMVADLRKVLLGGELTPTSTERLKTWLIASTTGAARLRAGVPAGWKVGDKTGTGDNGSTNDIAILWPPGRAPILAAVYCMGSKASTETISKAIADIGAIVAEAMR